MKTLGFFAFLAFLMSLGLGWQRVRADDPMRTIEIAELHRTLDPALIADLDGPPALAARAALAIGRTKRSAGAPVLRAHVRDADAGVRAMSVYGLGLLADATSLDAVRGLARSDRSSAVRYAALDALGRIVSAHAWLASRDVADDVLIVARSDHDAHVRAHADAQFDVFRTATFAPDLARALGRLLQSETDQSARWHVAWAISRAFPTLAAPSVLRSAAHDRNEIVRLEAVRAWGRRSGPEARAIVTSARSDPSWRVQYEAREAALRLAKQPPTEHLTAVPEGIHLPPIPAFVHPAVTPPASSPPGSPLVAPVPAALDAGRFEPPPSAAAMNAGMPGASERARIETTQGIVTVALYRAWAPSTVANFLMLARTGYFSGNRWFRIVPDFVVQTGDPHDDGEGDAGYMIGAEENPLEERAGVIAMGLNYADNKAERDSAGTQFYITLSPQLHLDRDFSVFGEVTGGFDVLAHLSESDRIIRVSASGV